MTRAISKPSNDEKRRGELAAQVRDGLLTPQEAEARLRSLRSGAPRPDRSATRAQVPR